MVLPKSTGTHVGLWLLILVFSVAMVWAGEKVCTIGPSGKVTTFSGETADVTLPCKYRLADFTCDDFHVKVVPGSAVDDEGRFDPDTLWLKVVNMATGEQATVRTSRAILSENKNVNGYQVKEGNIMDVGGASLGSSPRHISFGGASPYRVEFNLDTSTVLVKCLSDNFTSLSVPHTLCGDGTTPQAMEKAKDEISGNRTLAIQQFLHYSILNDATITQSKTCKNFASKFQSCSRKLDAVSQCADIFADSTRAQCLAKSDTPLVDYYNVCLSAVCDADAVALATMTTMLKYLDDNCHNRGSPEACPSGPLSPTKCAEDKDCGSSKALCNYKMCKCRPGFFFSRSTKCCVQTCKQLRQLNLQGGYQYYAKSHFKSDAGVLQEIKDSSGKACYAECAKNDQCVTASITGTPQSFTCTLYSTPAYGASVGGSVHGWFLQRTCE